MVALCDVDRNQVDPAAAEVEQLTGKAPKKYEDYRDLLDKEKPEIVSVAIYRRSRDRLAIAALQAGWFAVVIAASVPIGP